MTSEGAFSYAGCALEVRVTECVAGEKASLRVAAQAVPAQAPLPFSLELELLAETAGLVFPDRFFASMASVAAATAGSWRGGQTRVVRARAVGEGEVEVVSELEGEPSGFRSARLHFSPAAPVPPSSHPSGLFVHEPSPPRRGLLYESCGENPVEAAEGLRVVSDAWIGGLGHMTGCLAKPARTELFSPLPPCLVPAAVEGALHLVLWNWYALTGERGQPGSIGSLRTYRRPLGDEDLRADVRLKGTRAGKPCFDAILYGADRLPVLELRDICLTSHPSPPGHVIRSEWQRFVRILRNRETQRP